MKKILLGMSGGTDSTVSALLLKNADYEVTGITFRFFEKDGQQEYLQDASDACQQIGIPHIVYDARAIFSTTVIDYFIAEYMSGRTPVPCVVCNNQLKWPLLAKIADKNGIMYIATGHYVQTREHAGFIHFVSGKDPEKDQSFFLWGLKQELIRRIVFPLGTYTKTEVRKIAAEQGLKKAATKKDSLGVCFCPGDYQSFLRNELKSKSIPSGFFYDTSGKIAGKHQGYPFYTVGQRRGLGLQLNKPVFVKEIHPETNRIILDNLAGLYKRQMILHDFNLVNESLVLNSQPIICKIRYRKQATPAIVSKINENELIVTFLEPLESIAPGQAAAFYNRDCLLGGGIIQRAID